jgi:glucose uptake protein
MVFFGLYIVPRKLCRLKHLEFVLSMGIGVMATMLPAWGIARAGQPFVVPAHALAYAFLCGPVWTLGIIFFTLAVDRIGLTLATPIKNTTAVLGTLAGLLFFQETRHTYAVPATIGSILIVLCAVIIGRAGEVSEVHFATDRAGVAYSLLAAFFFAAYAVPLKIAMSLGLDSYTIVLTMSLGIILSSTLGLKTFGLSLSDWRRQPLPDHLWGALSGSCWAMATMTMSAAIARIGLAVTWPITNLNTIVTILFGAYVFHEIPIGKRWPQLARGALAATAGVILLGLSKH